MSELMEAKYKILRVGDPHVMVSNLVESRKLMDYVIKLAKELQIDRIEFLGDLFHTHAVVRSEVLNFWHEVFTEIGNAEIMTKVLVGNHDQVGDKERENLHALIPFKNYGYIHIIDTPRSIGPIGYVPYMSDPEAFIAAAEALHREGVNHLVCHQTFQGSTFENGFYAEDGIDLARIPQAEVTSGHIHKGQQIGKCDYPGTAKWDKATDAGSDKGLWYYEHDYTGKVTKKTFFTTKEIVTPIYEIIVREGEEEPVIPAGARVALQLMGQTAWIAKMKKKYKNQASIRAIPTDRRSAKVDKTVSMSILDYVLNNFNPIEGVAKEDIANYIRKIDGSQTEHIAG